MSHDKQCEAMLMPPDANRAQLCHCRLRAVAAERDALRALLAECRACIAPPSVRFEAGYPLPAHLRITAERAQLLGRIDAALRGGEK